MQPHQTTPAGVQPAGASEQTKQHNANTAVLGTDDDIALERRIRELGVSMELAYSQGDRAKAISLLVAMTAAIASRRPEVKQWMEADAIAAAERGLHRIYTLPKPVLNVNQVKAVPQVTRAKPQRRLVA